MHGLKWPHSIFVGAHDGEHARRNVRVGGVFRAAFHVERVVVQLEEVGFSLDIEAAKIVLFVRVIVLREIAEGLNRQNHASLGIDRQGIDALRHDDPTADESALEGIIQESDAVSV
jgi:hypothetical protein